MMTSKKETNGLDNPKELRTISLCHGYGGIERGLELAGERIKPVAICEIEAYAIATTIKKMEEGSVVPCPVWTNVKTFPVSQFPPGSIDLLTGGYPCQPFSTAGARRGKKDPRHLWPHIAEIIRSIKPLQCFFENVQGHITEGLRDVLDDLGSMGYRTTWGIFSAEEICSSARNSNPRPPHERKRVFISANSPDHRYEQTPGTKDEAWEKGLFEVGELSGGPEGLCSNELPDTPGVKRNRALGPEEEGWARSSDRGLEPSCSEKRSHPHPPGLKEQNKPITVKEEIASATHCMWPSRPGEPQYQWEPPRIVIKSGLGRVPNGSPHRVDRVRLLGNGVIPWTAAIGWITLNKRLNKRCHQSPRP